MLNDEQILTNFWGETVILILSTLKFWLLTQMNLRDSLDKTCEASVKKTSANIPIKIF